MTISFDALGMDATTSCSSIISDSEVKSSFVVKSRGVSCQILGSGCISSNHKYSNVQLYIGEDSLLRPNDYSRYEYIRVGEKKIAVIAGIHFRECFRGQGIATEILRNKSRYLKRKKFSSIELKAISDGVLVWPRLGFKLKKFQHEVLLRKHALEYLHEVRKIPVEKLKYNSVFDIDASLLRNNEEFPQSFTSWLALRSKECFEMSKEL